MPGIIHIFHKEKIPQASLGLACIRDAESGCPGEFYVKCDGRKHKKKYRKREDSTVRLSMIKIPRDPRRIGCFAVTLLSNVINILYNKGGYSSSSQNRIYKTPIHRDSHRSII